MSNIQTGAERMPHDLSHLGFLAGQIGRLITISTTPVIAGDSFEMDAVGALRLSPLRRGLAIDSTVDIFTFYVPHRHVYGEQWIKFMKDGVNATPLPTVNTTGYIDHAAFLGTINPDTNKIPKHLFQGYLNIYNNYFKAPWMPDRTEANPNELNQDDARYGFRCCHLKNIWTAPLPPETELSRQMTTRSEERFSRNAETDLVCRLLLEKKKFDIFLRFVGLGARIWHRRLCLRDDRLLPRDVLFLRREVLDSTCEFMLPLVGFRFPVADSFLAVQEFDRAPLEELPFSGEFSLLAFHRLPDLVRLARFAVRRDEAFLCHRGEPLTHVRNAAFNLFPRPFLIRQPRVGVCALLFKSADRIPRLSLELGNLRCGFSVANVNFVLRGEERVPFLFEGLLSIRRGLRIGLLGFEVPARGELLRHLERLHRSRHAAGDGVLHPCSVIRKSGQPGLLTVQLFLSTEEVRGLSLEFRVLFGQTFLLRLESRLALRGRLVEIRFRFGGSSGRCSIARGEMRIRGRQQEGGPVDVFGCEMTPRKEDEDQLAALERGEHIFSDEERIAIADSFRRQHLEEIIVIDWAIRIEDVFAGHLSAFVEHVDLLELRPRRFSGWRGHQDRGESRAETSH